MEIEKVILENLVYNDEYSRKVLPFILDEYFIDQKHKIVFDLIKTYFDKYNNFPPIEALKVEFQKCQEHGVRLRRRSGHRTDCAHTREGAHRQEHHAEDIAGGNPDNYRKDGVRAHEEWRHGHRRCRPPACRALGP